MFSRNNAVQIDQFFAGVRGADGGILADGIVIAYVANARNQQGNFVYRRAELWQDAGRFASYLQGEVALDSGGLPLVSSGQKRSVYGDGSLLLYYYPSTATNLPDGTEEGQEQLPPGIDSPDRVETVFISTEIVNAAHFGAKGDANFANPLSGTDDTDALQAAIDYCLVDANKRPKVLYIPGGTYRITRPLIVMQTYLDDNNQTRIGYCAIHVHGEKRGLGDAYGDTIIYAEFTDKPAMIIQGGYGVIVRDLSFVGVNRYDLTLAELKKPFGGDQTFSFALYHDDNVYFYDWSLHPWSNEVPPINPPYPLLGKCRDNAQSPYAGIAIDPFASGNPPFDGSLPPGVLTTNQYPGLTVHYQYAALDPKEDVYAHSSGVIIDNCSFVRFVAGIVITPTGRNKNAENIIIRNVLFQTNKVGLAICQSQTRGIQVENCAALQCHTVLDCRSYGAGTAGTAPNIRGLTVSEAKFLFNVNATSSFSIEQVYAEAFLSIGYLGADFSPNQCSVTVTGSTFDFQHIRPAIHTHLNNFAGVKFLGCLFTITGGSTSEFPPVMFANYAPLTFEDCVLQTGRYFGNPTGVPTAVDWGWANSAPAWGFHEPLLVRINGVRLRDNLNGGHTGSALSSVMRDHHLSVAKNAMDSTGLTRHIVPPGTRIAPAAGSFLVPTFSRVVKGDVNEIPMVSVLVKPSGTDVTFTAAPNLLLPGDVVYAYTNAGSAAFYVPLYHLPAIGGGSPNNAELNPTTGYGTLGPIGVITVASSGVNTVGFVPKGFLDAIGMGLNLTLRVKRFGRYHPATIGTLRTTSSTITGVTVEGVANAAVAWKVGDRIFTDRTTAGGLPVISPGTYVTAVSTSSIIMSRNPAADVDVARLFDADVYRFAATGE